MGLAPYGQPKYVKEIRQLIEAGRGGKYRLNLKYYSFLQEDRMFSEDLCELLGEPPRSYGSEITQFHTDIARSAQLVLEDILLAKVRYLHTAFLAKICVWQVEWLSMSSLIAGA